MFSCEHLGSNIAYYYILVKYFGQEIIAVLFYPCICIGFFFDSISGKLAAGK